MTAGERARRRAIDPRAERALGLLGLARRAGRLAVGTTAVVQLVERGDRPVVVIAADASGRQRAKLRRLAPVRGFVDGLFDRDDLARQLGRRELVVVAVADPGFVRGLVELGVVADSRADSATLD
ncbi:MAG TPA: ribosomal L7Ae/L30e/S12e/Gadd45 family protein [Candidatus Krumholzibacteria bacterium]|nr:ribosomal L7Ae/L30e/S12e/Gadd45 family protein [Candidatus Krumholzibacteria bacterium]HPD71308.1 ribosomal L7Ae/L30e/S12e/Gadd45 family protein [Candidatus Krumholzibacteria bacterium]HRY38992.1 ribosomal L7Ae/L30e/S12e/Gadd45 family protein [Candidatus Krumholzibacteria bacterium]